MTTTRRSPAPRVPALAAALALAIGGACSAHSLEEETEQVAALLELRPGLALADVGAGDGDYGEGLARRLAGSGRVYLTEIDEGELGKLRRLRERSGLGNLIVVEGTETDTGLPEACCDAILLRLVYHHMTRGEEMRAALERALRPGGRILVIEMDRESHGLAPERLVEEMTGNGFAVVSRHPEWGGHSDHYAVLFRLAGPAVGEGSSALPGGGKPRPY